MEFKRIINLIIVFYVTNSFCDNILEIRNVSEEILISTNKNNLLDRFDWSVALKAIQPLNELDEEIFFPPVIPTTDESTTTTQSPSSNIEHQWFLISIVFIPAAAVTSSIVLFLLCTMKEAVPPTGFITPIVSIPRV